MRAVVGLRRWRHNPLCRTTDLAEAWTALAALLLICLVSPAVGWLCGSLTDASLQRTVRAQQEQRHRTTAEVLAPAPEIRTAPRDPEAAGYRLQTSVTARWTAPDGTPRTGTLTTSERPLRPGDTFSVWTDARGRQAARPMSADIAREQAVLAGVGAALGTAGLAEGARRLVVRQLVRRRYADLDRAWARTGPDWGRTGADS